MSNRKSQSRRALVVALTAALGSLAITGLTLGYVLAGESGAQNAAPAATPSAKSAACVEVTRQYTWWKEESRSLAGLPNLEPTAARARAQKLQNDTEALLGTLGAFGAASDLAAVAARYHLSVGLLGIDIELGGEVNQGAYNEVLVKHKAVEDAYTAFLRASC